MYEYDGITFMLNKKCKYECESCFKGCNANAHEKLDKTVIIDVINQLPTQIREVNFTGGEPFEEYEDLVEYVGLARKRNKIVICDTSCFWADDYEHTYKLIKELRRAGLAKITIDYDGIHYRKEKINNVINVIDAAIKNHIGFEIRVTNIKSKKLGDEISLLGDKLINSGLIILDDKRGKQSKKLEQISIAKGIKAKLFINYDGDINAYMYSHIHGQVISSIYNEKDINKIIQLNTKEL